MFSGRVKMTFKFLFVGGYTIRGDRKGADLLAKAFNVFEAADTIKLIYKINTSYNPSFDAEADLRSLIKPELQDKVEFITKFMTDEELADLYRSCDVSVTPTMGEAFCQSILESLAVGTPAIVTDYSGHLDYCIKGKRMCYFIDIEKRVLAHYGSFDVSCGSVWVKPSVAHLAKLMLRAFKDPKEVEEMGRNAAEYVHSCMKWADQAKKLVEVINSVV